MLILDTIVFHVLKVCWHQLDPVNVMAALAELLLSLILLEEELVLLVVMDSTLWVIIVFHVLSGQFHLVVPALVWSVAPEVLLMLVKTLANFVQLVLIPMNQPVMFAFPAPLGLSLLRDQLSVILVNVVQNSFWTLTLGWLHVRHVPRVSILVTVSIVLHALQEPFQMLNLVNVQIVNLDKAVIPSILFV